MKIFLKFSVALIVFLCICILIGQLLNQNYKFPDPPFRHPAIPERITDVEMDLAVARFTASFQQNCNELYERLDPIGKSISENKNFTVECQRMFSKYGSIGKREFSGAYMAEKLADGVNQYQLVYKVELPKTDFKVGKLTLFVADRGDHLGLIRVSIAGYK